MFMKKLELTRPFQMLEYLASAQNSNIVMKAAHLQKVESLEEILRMFSIPCSSTIAK